MDNLSLGYNFGTIYKGCSLNVSAMVQNVFCITKYSGVDPVSYTHLVKNLIEERKERVKDCSVLCIRVNRTKALPEGLSAGFVTSDGYTYKSPCPAPSSEGIIRIPLKDLRQTRCV